MSDAQGHKTPLEGVAIHGFSNSGNEYVDIQVDSNGRLEVSTIPTTGGVQKVEGNVAHDAVDSGNPVKIGIVASTDPPIVTLGDRTDIHGDRQGAPFVVLKHPDFSLFASIAATTADSASTSTAILYSTGYQFEFNGTSWDRLRHSHFQTDTFTGTGNGTAVDMTTTPMSKFSLQVKATGAVTSWDVRLECSNDGTNYDATNPLIAHTNIDGDGVVKFAVDKPCRFIRARVAALVLGGGTNIVVSVLASGR